MSSRVRIGKSRPFVRFERLIAIAAVGATAFGFTQPQVLSLAGLDFANPQVASHGIDPAPTGSITLKPVFGIGESSSDHIHGLAGTLKPLRNRQ